MNHDYGHCANERCPLAKRCFRAYLHREDIRIKKAHPDWIMWCSYSSFRPDESGQCEHFGDVGNWGIKEEPEEEPAEETEEDVEC